MLTQGAKVLVIQPTDSRPRRLRRGSRTSTAPRSSPTTARSSRPDLDYYVSHDSYKVGVLQAEAAIAATGGKGKYVLLSGQAGHSVATEITRGYERHARPVRRARRHRDRVQQNHSAWSPEQALRTVEDALTQTGDTSTRSSRTTPAWRAARCRRSPNAGLTNVFIAGADADAANVNFVCQGKQSIEVLKDIAAARANRGRGRPRICCTATPSTLRDDDRDRRRRACRSRRCASRSSRPTP